MNTTEKFILGLLGGAAIGFVGYYAYLSYSQPSGSVTPSLPNAPSVPLDFSPSNNAIPQSSVPAQETSSMAPISPVAVSQTPPENVLITAQTLYGEARNQTREALQGVASVILNRASHDPSRLAAICLAPKQFDCWIPGTADHIATINAPKVGGAAWEICLQIAQQAALGTLPDNTNGATFYFSPPLSAPPRSWGNVINTANIDELHFYRAA